MGPLAAPWSLLPSGTFLSMLALFFTVFALLYDFLKRRRSWGHYPPGPTSMPFLGNILQADFKNVPKYVAQLRKKYGDVFSLQFCWTNVVIMSGFESVKEGLITKSDDTSDRPHFIALQKHGFKENSSGVLLARYGQSWRDVRRFSLSTLRDFGLGKKSLAERVTEEAGFLCSAFKSKDGRPFDPHLMINNAVSNVICSIIFGDRFEYDDKHFRKVLKLFEDIIGSGTDVLLQLANVIPVLVHVPGVGQKLFRAQETLFSFLRSIITEHKESWDPNLKRDFIDAFLEEVEKVKGDPQSSFSELNLLVTVSDMFSAGTETTSTTLRHGLLYMMLYPDIQRRVQEEIDQVIGRERKPTMDDRANMPYTNAVIHEIQRYSDILPLSVPHMTSRDTEVNGYFIPKGTTLMFNLSSVLKDESIWARPYQFYPEHFLDDDGQFIKREAFLPFSAALDAGTGRQTTEESGGNASGSEITQTLNETEESSPGEGDRTIPEDSHVETPSYSSSDSGGRRVCLAEQLARMELFLFFTTFLQQFTFFIPRDQPRPKEETLPGAIRAPKPYQLCAEVR